MRKIKSTVIKTTAVTSTTALLIWAGVGTLPHASTKAHHAKNFTQAATELLKMNTAIAAVPGYTQNIVNSIRSALGTVIGFGSRASYITFACNGSDPGAGAACDGPPQVGIVGAATALTNQLPTIAASAGITACEKAPASGAYAGKDSSGTSVSLTFAAPTHTVPTGWVGGGVSFDHRVVFASNLTNIGPSPVPIKIAYEFNCGANPSSYVAISMPIDGHASFTRDITVYNGVYSSTEKGIEVYYSEHNGTTIRGIDGMRIAYNESSHQFKMWTLMATEIEPTMGQGYQMLSKIFVNGDYTTGKALVFARNILGRGLSGDPDGAIDTAIGALAGANDATVESNPGNNDMSTDLLSVSAVTTAANGSPNSLVRYACINFNTPSVTNAPGHADCSAFTITAPTTPPSIDAGGSWNIQYLFSLSAHLEHVN